MENKKIIMLGQTFFLLIFSIIATVSAHLCFKQGVLKLGELNFSLNNFFGLIGQILHNFWLLSGVVIFGLSFLAWIFIISRIQLNIVYPVAIASEVTLVAVGSWLIFKEYLAFWQIMGIALIVLGIFLILKP